jgi:hypothetical protein
MAAEQNYGVEAEKFQVHKISTLSSPYVGDDEHYDNYEHDQDDYYCNNKHLVMQ